jgi:hypothetical protein
MTPIQERLYPEELSRLLAADAAARDARPAPAPELPKYRRRMRDSRWVKQPDGQLSHVSYSRDATPEEEEWCQKHAPERGLLEDGIRAYRLSQLGPVGRFFMRLVFWR